MKYFPISVCALSFLAACSGVGNPIFDAEAENPLLTTEGEEENTETITRFEPLDTDTGGGYAQSMSYDATDDTFTVDNLAFDGTNVYARGTAIASLGPFMVFDGAETVVDSGGGPTVIDQFFHRAVFGASTTGATEFAIARTGQYVPYGFGGFMYTRRVAVSIPTTGQAAYSGRYAGIRVFQNDIGLEFTEADMTAAIDFEDFNEGNAIQGRIFNRIAYDSDGNVLPTAADKFSMAVHLPEITFAVGPGAMASNGVIEGAAGSYARDQDGALVPFETGKYYGVLAGPDASELVGVIVVESLDPRAVVNPTDTPSVAVQETGGFILYRP